MIEIEAPDGTIVEFPEGTSDEVILRVMRQNFGGPSQQAPQEQGRTIGQTIYENVIGSGEVDTPGERIGQLIKGAGAGMMRGGAELLGLPGTIGGAMDIGAKKLGLLREDAPSSPVMDALGGAGLRKGLSMATGGASEYVAPGRAGKFAGTVGEFIPGAAAFGGATAGNLLRYGVAPGVASEAAGQAFEGTSLETPARIGAAMLAPAAVNAMERGVRTAISPFGGADPERLKLARVLDDYGVPVTAGQRVGSEGLRRVEGATSRGEALSEIQADKFTKEILKTAGINADRATPEVLSDAFKSVGDMFDDAVKGATVTPSGQDLVKMSNALETYRQLTPSANIPPILGNVNKEMVNAFRSGNAIPASNVKTWRSTLSKLTASSDAATREAAREMMEAVDDAVSASLTAAGRAADVAKLNTARGQYRNLLAIERAAAQAGEGARSGILSPQAVARAVSMQGRRSFVTGKRGDIGELSAAAEGVIRPLPTVAAGGIRSIRGLPEALGAGAGVAAFGGPVGAAVGALAPSVARAAAMTAPVQRYLANQLVGQMPERGGSILSTIPGLLAQ